MSIRSPLFPWLLSLPLLACSWQASAASPPAEVLARLKAGEAVDLIVEYDSAAIDRSDDKRRLKRPRQIEEAADLTRKAGEYRQLKDRVDRARRRNDLVDLADYDKLPMRLKRFGSAAALAELLTHPEVKAVYPNAVLHPVLAQSLPMINQPAVAAAGEAGEGVTVAVIDNGIDYTNAAFGGCTAPGSPSSCRVSASVQFGSGTTDNNHGTNVAAIVLGVAPKARVAMLNAFSGTGAYTADIISAINWAITNRSAYNIVAINMSLGDGTKNTTTCQSGNPFYTPITNARNAGISVVAAAGNDAYTNALGRPACTPGAISVGAVYDASLGSMSWSTTPTCTDASTAPDQVACFSDSASFLTLLAPGALITAAGITEAGTSQAAPHVAGAVAVLRAAFPNETLSQIQQRMTGSGVAITDPKSGVTTPRLNLLAAARPANDAFSAPAALSGASGSASGLTLLATKESGEPNHAGNAGGHSVWWKWTAPAAGQLSLDSHGSDFDTLLAVYTGSGVAALSAVAANDDDGSSGNNSGLIFQAQAGTEYQIAVDGKNAAAGTATLNWSLNTSAKANLSISLSGPGAVAAGTTASYTLTVANAGPQAATHVVASVTLPAGGTYAGGPAACAAAGSLLTCTLDVLASGASASFPLQLTWGTVASGAAVTASVASDLPDPSATDNSGAIAITTTGASSDGDVPTLPQWASLLMAALLLGLAVRRKAEPDRTPDRT